MGSQLKRIQRVKREEQMIGRGDSEIGRRKSDAHSLNEKSIPESGRRKTRLRERASESNWGKQIHSGE